MIFLGKENPTFCWYFPMELNKEKKTGLGQMVGTGWMLLILLQNIYQTYCQKQCSLKKIVSVHFSNLRILELVCENAKTQATPGSIVSPLTHNYPLAGGWAAPWRRRGAETTTARNRCSRWQGTDPKSCQGPCWVQGESRSFSISADQVLGMCCPCSAHHPRAVGFVPLRMSERRSSRERSGNGRSWEVLTPLVTARNVTRGKSLF